MKGRVLFVISKFMNLYKDIIQELKKQNYEVTFIEDARFYNRFLSEPIVIEGHHFSIKSRRIHEKMNEKYWKRVFHSQENMYYDYLLVVDGFCICKYMIERLKKVNPKIKKILYLYDSVQTTYHFDWNFTYFDSIFTFDIADADKFNLNVLPIYWKESPTKEISYKIFGFASFGKSRWRFDVYSKVEELSNRLGLNSFIKLYVVRPKESPIKLYLKKKLKRDISLLVNQRILTTKPMKPDEFRTMINSSDIILDALNNEQHGLTARFCWAMGAGKKIITNNIHAKEYPFYDSEEIYIITNNGEIPIEFIEKRFVQKDKTRQELFKFRIDNWIKTLFRN